MITTSPSTESVPLHGAWRKKVRTWWLVVGVLLIAAIPLAISFINLKWPYRYRNVKPLLEAVLASQIKVEHYHRTYFPNPGFVATGLTLQRKTATGFPPIGKARSLFVQGSWADLLMLRERVKLVDVEGLVIAIPPKGSPASRADFPPGSSADFSGPTTDVDQLNIHDARLEIQRTNGDSYSFPIRQLIFRHLRKDQPASFSLDMQSDRPFGRVQAKGAMGPLLPDKLAATPVNGDFTYTGADLANIGDLKGILTAAGRFKGTLGAIDTEATSEVAGFAVGDGNATRLTSSGHGTVNALTGDMFLEGVDTRLGATTVHTRGTIAGSPKVTNLDFAVSDGFAEDLLHPFVNGESPIRGKVWLRSHAYLAPAERGLEFLQRLRMDGTFDVPAERWTDQNAETKLSAFSERAQGHKVEKGSDGSDLPENSEVLSSLKGPAIVRDGVASSQRLNFQVPGAGVDLKGSFDLRTHAVKMTGDLHMQSDISHTTTGFKSVLMKPLAPFFKKGHAGAVVPIAITGSPGHYNVTENLMHDEK